ncbi:MAG: glycosyltransferase [Bacteroidales bacterium]|nr:glycosyltransferase [Bacteroidales bacterium]
MPACGWQPVIYTPKNPERLAVDESLLADIPPEAEVYKRRIFEPYAFYRAFLGGKKEAVNPIHGQKKSFASRLALWLRGNFFVPDPRRSWVRPSVRYLKKYLAEHPVDVVVTTGPPHAMHLIGEGLKRETGVRWVADFRDPWTKMYNFETLPMFPWVKAAHRRLEQRVLDGSDAVIAVTALVRDDFQQRTQTPVSLITNGFDEADYAGAAPALSATRFTLVHTGLFEKDGNPLRLWDVLARKCAGDRDFKAALEIRLAGKIDPEIFEALAARGLAANVKRLGYQAHPDTVREQRAAAVLLLPLRDAPEYRKTLPGKIFEYLAARRPVLGIGQEDGVAAKLLHQCGAGVMYGWDQTEPVAHFIDHCWEEFRSGTLAARSGDISAYSRRALTGKLVELLSSL